MVLGYVKVITAGGKPIRNDLYNSPPDTFSYIIFKEGDLIKAKNGRTGQIEFQGSDASTVIQQAVDSVYNSGGGRILLRSGTYILLDTVILKDNVELEGEGYNTVLDTRVQAGIFGAAINVDGSNTAIRNLRVIGDNSPIEAKLITIYPSKTISNIAIENIVIENASFQSLVASAEPTLDYTVENVRVKGCVFRNAKDCLVVIGTKHRKVTVEDCIFIDDNQSATGIDVWQSDYAIRVVNNYIYNTRIGISINKSENGNYISDLHDVVVQGNYVNHTSGNGILVYSGRDVVIRDNYVIGAAGDGIHIRYMQYNSNKLYSWNVIVEGNRISHCGFAGIMVLSSTDIIIKNNITEYNNKEGIKLYEETVGRKSKHIIESNIIRNNSQESSGTYSGIYVSNITYASIKNNIIYDDQSTKTQSYGIAEVDDSDYNQIIGNICYGNINGNIRTVGPNTIVRDNEGYVTENSGTATFSGDGTTKDFSIGAHGLAVTDPEKIVVKVTPISSDAIDASPCVGYVDPADNTKIRVKFANPPASGTDNVKIKWEAQVV